MNNETENIYDMYSPLKRMLLHAAVILLILTIARCCFAVAFVPMATITGHTANLGHLVFNALRFDLQVAAYTLLLPTALTLLAAPLHRPWKACALSRFRRAYFAVADILILMVSGIDLGFYANFNSHINLTFFDFFNEGPASLLQTIWEEYHCVYETIGFLVVAMPVLWAVRKIERPTRKHSKPLTPRMTAILWTVYATGLAVCLRGSVWRFPLQIEDTFVSSDKTFNDLVPNGIYMLKKAIKEKRNAFRLKTTAELLGEYHFESLQQAFDTYTGRQVRIENHDTLKALRQALFAYAPDTITHRQPNVVIIYSESWSNYLLNLQDSHTEILFGLRHHLADGLLFRNFQSVQNGTIPSLENLFVATPFPRFFASSYRFRLMPTSIALPFRASGYTTLFMSGMDTAWENCAESLIHQHFNAVYDKFHILRDYPRATYNSIGVYDEYLFNALLDRLNTPSAHPRMITVMTTTNHPPFEFPAGLHLPPLPRSVYDRRCFAEHNPKVLDKYLTGFRYFNKVLGEFLDRFKASPAAHNTILIVTGDHNVRTILDFNTIDKRYHHSVPLYIYLPPSLRKPFYRHLTRRWGSHDDLLPTLAPFALRHTRYFRLGKNLLDPSAPDSIYYSANVDQLESAPTYRTHARRQLDARNLLRLVYFTRILRQ